MISNLKKTCFPHCEGRCWAGAGHGPVMQAQILSPSQSPWCSLSAVTLAFPSREFFAPTELYL